MFEQDRVLVRLQQRVIREPAIQVCFLSGSYGRGTQDEYSDLDVTLVYGDENSRDLAYSQRHDFVRSVLPYVPAKSFDADHIQPYFHIALYSNGAKADYLFETIGSIKPRPQYREIHLLKDSEGWGAQLIAESARLTSGTPPPTATAELLAALDSRFWVIFMDVFRQLRRGDHTRPFPVYLRLLTFTIPDMLDLLPSEDPAHQGLIQAFYSEDTVLTLEHLRHLLKAYLAARSAIIQRHRMVYVPDRRFEDELVRKINRP